jgi:hypothetical protein
MSQTNIDSPVAGHPPDWLDWDCRDIHGVNTVRRR